jgi:uncharacterized protein YoaH (UPF0181 family)
MKTIKCRKTVFLSYIAAAMVLYFAAGGGTAAGQAATDQIKSSIERSQLSSADKAELLDAAGRALQAGIPADDVEIIITRGRERRVDVETTRKLLDTVVKVREQGLPMRPVLNRIEQGLSKGVPPERISAASERLAEKMAEAEPIVGGLVRGGVKAESGRDREYAIETVARALEKSVSKDAITGAGERVKERRGSVALFDKAVHTMTNLMDSGMSSGSASRIVHEAVKKGFSEKDLTRMERDVVEGLKRGKQMDDVIKSSESELKGDGKKSGGSREDRDVRREESRDDKSGPSRDERDVRREGGRDDRSGGSRDSGSDRVRDSDRGGKEKDR